MTVFQPYYNVFFIAVWLSYNEFCVNLDSYGIGFLGNSQDHVSFVNHVIQPVFYGFGME